MSLFPWFDESCHMQTCGMTHCSLTDTGDDEPLGLDYFSVGDTGPRNGRVEPSDRRALRDRFSVGLA